MEENQKVSLMLNIPKSFRDKLRKMAAEQNLNNPDQVTSASTIAKEIICEHLSMDLESKIKKSEEGCKNEHE
jgi:hypothetical protein